MGRLSLFQSCFNRLRLDRLERFPLAWNRLRPAPPPGHTRDRMLWVAGWGSGPEPNELEML